MLDREVLKALREAVRASLATNPPWPEADDAVRWRDGWPELAALGVFELVEDDGPDASMSMSGAVVVAEEFGRALQPGPFAGAATAVGWVAPVACPTASWLADAIAGSHVVQLVAAPEVTLTPTEVTGTTRVAPGAVQSDGFLLSCGADQRLVYVEANSDVVEFEVVPSLDVSRQYARVHLDRAPTAELPFDATTMSPLDISLLLDCADLLGGVERALQMTVAYAREREAFGHPIGRNQAVQFRLVDHTIALRGARLLVQNAAGAIDSQADDGRLQVRAAAANVARIATPLLSDLIQLTGAIGFTWEYGLHHFLRRATQTLGGHGGSGQLLDSLSRDLGWAQVTLV